jgi:serine/threonine protein kinase
MLPGAQTLTMTQPLSAFAFATAGQTGSFLNMAPEVVLNEPYDEKADIFSMGCCLFEVGCSRQRFPTNCLVFKWHACPS